MCDWWAPPRRRSVPGVSTLLLDRTLEAELSPTRLFTCSAAEEANVVAAAGQPLTPAQMRAAIGGAIAHAQREAAASVRALRARPRAAFTTAAFRGVFGVGPGWVPPWRPARASWQDLGDLVALRLERAARILGGGHMRFFCWGSVAHCPDCPHAPTSYRACSSAHGVTHVCLGRRFWIWFGQGRRAWMGAVLLHEALHVYFRLQHNLEAVGRPSVSNVHCYDTLVARLAGRAPKPGDVDRCRRGRTA